MDNIKEKTIGGLIYKFFERIGAQGISFVVSIILARILMPEEYGVIAMVLIFIQICDVFVTYGFGNSLIVDTNSDDVDFSTCFYFGLALAFVVYGIVFFSAPLIAGFYGYDILAPLIRVMGLRIPVAAINSVQHAYVSKYLMFRKFFFSALWSSSISGVVSIFLAYQGFGVWALAAQYLTMMIVDTICLWVIVEWRPKKFFSFERLKKIYDYGWKILAVGLIDTGYGQLRDLVIAKKYKSDSLGYYNRGNQFPGLAMAIVEPTLGNVIFPALSQYNENFQEAKSAIRRIVKLTTYIITPVLIGLMAVSEPLIRVLLTDKWLPCEVFLIIGCLANLLYPLQVINTSVIRASGRSGLLLKIDILKKSLGITILILSIPYGLIGIALSLLWTNIISTIINIYPNKQLLNYGYGEQFFDFVNNAGVSVLMGVCVFVIRFLNIPSLVTLILQIILGALLFVGLSKIFKLESYCYLHNMLREKVIKRIRK